MKIGRLWLIVAAACIVPAILDGVTSYVQARLANRIPGWQEIFWQSNEWLILGALTPIAYALAQRFPLRPPIRARNLLAHAGGAVLLCIGWASAGASLRWVLDIAPTGVSKSQQMASSWPASRLVPTSSGGHRRILRDPEVIRAALSFAENTIATRT